MSVTARALIDVTGTLYGTADLGIPRFDFSGRRLLDFLPGSGAAQANIVWSDTRTLGAAANEDLDLAGSLAGHLGGTATFSAVKLILVEAAPGNVNNVVVGAAGSNQFVGPFGGIAHSIAVPPNGAFCIFHPGAGWAVTSGTGDFLRIGNSGGTTSVTYDIVLIGH